MINIDVYGIKFNVSDAPVSDKEMSAFWEKYNRGEWETYTIDIYKTFLKKDYTYLDIGCWIGPTVLHGAQLAKKCYCFEPDNLSYKYLLNNIEANPDVAQNINAYNFGISDKNEQVNFYVGSGSTSMSSMIPNSENEGSYYKAEMLDIETMIKRTGININDVNFIKIDVGGTEYNLIPKLIEFLQKNNSRPTLYLSIHAPFLFKTYWRKNFFTKLISFIPRKIYARYRNYLLIKALRNHYKYLYLRGKKLLESLSELGDARAFTEIVCTEKTWI